MPQNFMRNADDHLMWFGGELRGEQKLSHKATANFTPLTISIAVWRPVGDRPVVLKQLRFAGKPQLREDVPVSAFARETDLRRFEPILAPVNFGDEVEAEFDAPEGTGVSLTLAGILALDTYVARLMEAGTRVSYAPVGISEGEPNSHTFPRQDPDGTFSIIVQTQPQMFFLPRWLAVSPECAPFYDITDIRVGKDSCLVATSPIAASCFPPLPASFDEARKYMRLDMPIVVPGIIVTLSANTRKEMAAAVADGKRPLLRAALHGIVIDP
jgi:hypothetical protein